MRCKNRFDIQVNSPPFVLMLHLHPQSPFNKTKIQNYPEPHNLFGTQQLKTSTYYMRGWYILVHSRKVSIIISIFVH